MAIDLVIDVLDHAPRKISSGELAVLIAIAEAMRTPGVPRDIPQAELLRRVRMTADGLRRVLRRLTANGVQVRVPIAKDVLGRPLYAANGRVSSYLLPEFEAPKDCECDPCRNRKARRESSLAEQGKTVDPPSREDHSLVLLEEGKTTDPHRGPRVLPTPSVRTSRARVRAHAIWCGECDEETRQVDRYGDNPRRCPKCHRDGERGAA